VSSSPCCGEIGPTLYGTSRLIGVPLRGDAPERIGFQPAHLACDFSPRLGPAKRGCTLHIDFGFSQLKLLGRSCHKEALQCKSQLVALLRWKIEFRPKLASEWSADEALAKNFEKGNKLVRLEAGSWFGVWFLGLVRNFRSRGLVLVNLYAAISWTCLKRSELQLDPPKFPYSRVPTLGRVSTSYVDLRYVNNNVGTP
jgi:hypothetical protein